MPEYISTSGALDRSAVAALRASLLASPYVARSTLAGSFRGSRGFAMTFTPEGRPVLEQRFPYLAGYLALALSLSVGRRLQPWPRRVLGARGRVPNAFYLNLLLLGDGVGVGRHVDATLRGPSGVAEAVPERVSVLYLSVPPSGRGGELRLYREGAQVGSIPPEEGTLLHFRGDLAHEVVPLEGAPAGTLRASLVCEQYHLPPEGLARLPSLQVQSKAGFAAYLVERRDQRTFELDG